ncbi:MAG: Hpt domain-containing protein, partial [Pseudomonadota bacterium]
SELLPGDRQVEEARAGLAAPGARLMQTVAAAIREDLARVKDVLDIYVRTGQSDTAELAPQLEMLKKISDTLGVLGLGNLRGDIQSEIERLRGIVESRSNVDDATLIQIAATLLRVEDNLERQLARLVRPQEAADADEDTASVPALTDSHERADYQQVTHAVVRECLINLARLKEAISRVAANNNDRVGIDQADELVRGVTAGLLMLGKNRARDVAERMLTIIRNALRLNSQPLEPGNMDRLADALVSLEYYLETIQAGRRDPWYMLDNAESCLDYLESIDFGADAETQAERTAQLSPELVEAALQAADADPLSTEVLGAPEQHDATELISLAVVSDEAEHIDPELLELFIEESKEEVEAIGKYLPRWVEDAEDNEALITVRRSFHTLKGSGRMVGAERIGEFCWSVEDLLNRLINRTLARTPPMVHFIREATTALPELIEQIESGTEPATDIGFLMAKANAFAEGDPRAATMQPPAAAGAEPALEMDPVLLDIFSKETAGHLDVARAFVADAREAEPPHPVSDALHRACHTLHGSVNMANVDRGVDITAALNRLTRRFFDNEIG